MELLCDNSHLHEPWGCNAQGSATAQETAYPWSLSRKIAQLIAVHLQQQGVQCPTPSSAKHAAHLDSSIRQQTHVQSSATRLPWVSEFSHIMQIPAQDPLPKNLCLISTPTMGDIPSAGIKAIGVYRSPQEFVEAALAARHLGVASDEMPGPMLDAVQFCASHSVSQVAQHRSEGLRRMIFRAQQLQSDEEALKRGM